ncbi:hypothetical protein PRZ48_006795 [Zasmidium cellare]|uniref:glucan endo-1,6-beta-glucosidase n=1 Tax=Zasmidium cellare TaxID=395010 RepID=A0ABR0EHK1_ZASCE|nr:hypothetical protein PRZ48_006795 [Zasmidium cellare]
MGCQDSASEFDCINDYYSGDQRDAGNQAFENHWSSWITPDTVDSVQYVGLNTIRIPIGYWSYTQIVDKSSEPFADGDRMLPYLDAVVGRAADNGMYVVIDFHGAPGGQQEDIFTGQNNHPAGFFNSYDYGRAEQWLSWMTNRIHTNSAYRTVGMIEVLNEPVSMHDHNNEVIATQPLTYYPAALAAVRQAEDNLNIASSQRLHVQFMSQKWLSGDPRATSVVQNDHMTSYDDHNYIGFALQSTSDQYSLMHSACTDSRLVSGEDFLITGEWSMTSGVDPNDKSFFQKFFTAQQQLYEVPGMSGWMFWTWKTQLIRAGRIRMRHRWDLSPSRRVFIEKWLDGISTTFDDSEISNEIPSNLQSMRRHRNSMSTSVTNDSIKPGSSGSNDAKRPRSPSPIVPRSLRRWPELMNVPQDADPQKIARAASYVSPMDKIDLLQDNNDNEICKQSDKILKDYTRHLVRSALKRGQQPDLVVSAASAKLETEYRQNAAKVLKQMLSTMVQEMNEDDQEIVQVVKHCRGICDLWECFMCERGSRSRGRVM